MNKIDQQLEADESCESQQSEVSETDSQNE